VLSIVLLGTISLLVVVLLGGGGVLVSWVSWISWLLVSGVWGLVFRSVVRIVSSVLGVIWVVRWSSC
jgi:hypothetical protein